MPPLAHVEHKAANADSTVLQRLSRNYLWPGLPAPDFLDQQLASPSMAGTSVEHLLPVLLGGRRQFSQTFRNSECKFGNVESELFDAYPDPKNPFQPYPNGISFGNCDYKENPVTYSNELNVQENLSAYSSNFTMFRIRSISPNPQFQKSLNLHL